MAAAARPVLPGPVLERLRAGRVDAVVAAAGGRPPARDPVTETVRAMLLGTPIGSNGSLVLAWTVGLATLAFVAAVVLFRRRMSDPATGAPARTGWLPDTSRELARRGDA